MEILLWSIISFLSGSIPYSLIIGKIVRNIDIRTVEDKNPGAMNVLRTAGPGWFILAFLLDGFKGAIPVGIAWFIVGVRDLGIIPIAVAPIIGHIFSPWLKFRGGKAISVTFGIWAGLTFGAGPTILGLLLLLSYLLVKQNGWGVVFAFLLYGFYIVDLGIPHHLFFVIWLLNLCLLIWAHRNELINNKPSIKNWIINIFTNNYK